MNNTSSESITIKNIFSKEESQKVKGVGILLMIFHHMYSTFMLDFQQTDLTYNVLFVIGKCCRICVFLFAIISAYGISIQYKKNKGSQLIYILTRWLKVMAPFWFTLLMIWLFFAIILRVPFNELYGDNYIQYMIEDFFCVTDLFGHSDFMILSVFWYMNFIVLQIITFPIVYFLSDKLGWIFLVISIAVYNFLPTVIGSYFSGDYKWYIFATILGIILYKYDLINKIQKIYESNHIIFKILIGSLSLCLAFLLMFFAEFVLTSKNNFMYPLFQTIAAYVLIQGIYMVMQNIAIKKVFVTLGKYSADMYLIHLIIIMVLGNVIGTASIIFRYLVCILISFTISFLLALLKKYSRYNRLVDLVCNLIDKCDKKSKVQS